MTSDSDHVTNYSCHDCGQNEWYIQNRVAPAAAFFNPEITHVECVNCGCVDESRTDSKNTEED